MTTRWTRLFLDESVRVGIVALPCDLDSQSLGVYYNCESQEGLVWCAIFDSANRPLRSLWIFAATSLLICHTLYLLASEAYQMHSCRKIVEMIIRMRKQMELSIVTVPVPIDYTEVKHAIQKIK